MTAEQQEFANRLDVIINGNGMTTVNFVNNDNNTLIGDITTGTVDIGDIMQIGEGQYVNQAGAFIHEFHEQFQVQVNLSPPLKAHTKATNIEGKVTGNVYDPVRNTSSSPNGTGTITVPVRNPNTGQWHNVIINYQNGNVINILR